MRKVRKRAWRTIFVYPDGSEKDFGVSLISKSTDFAWGVAAISNAGVRREEFDLYLAEGVTNSYFPKSSIPAIIFQDEAMSLEKAMERGLAEVKPRPGAKPEVNLTLNQMLAQAGADA